MSMRRLGLDQIDLYYLHTPTMIDAPFEEIVETLAGMRQEGLIRHIGMSNVAPISCAPPCRSPTSRL